MAKSVILNDPIGSRNDRLLSRRVVYTEYERLKVITAATETKGITLEQAKLYMRIDGDDDDNEINDEIDAASRKVEKFIDYRLFTQTVQMSLDFRPQFSEIRIPLKPLTAVTKIETIDTDNVATTFDATKYFTMESGATAEGAAVLNDGETWPQTDTLRRRDSVKVQFTVGFANQAAIPQEIQQAIKVTVADMHENRELFGRDLPDAAIALLSDYIAWDI